MGFHCVNSVFRLVLEGRERERRSRSMWAGDEDATDSSELERADADPDGVVQQKVGHTARSVSLQESPQGCHVDHSRDQLLECSFHLGEKPKWLGTVTLPL